MDANSIRYDLSVIPILWDKSKQFVILDAKIKDYHHNDTNFDIGQRHIQKYLLYSFNLNIISPNEINITVHNYKSGWQKAALKSRFLLTELIRLGAANNPTYELILDMMQDIDYPKFTELDKDLAGIPSAYTNIQEETDIDEPF